MWHLLCYTQPFNGHYRGQLVLGSWGLCWNKVLLPVPTCSCWIMCIWFSWCHCHTIISPLHSTPLTGRAIKPQRQGHVGRPIARVCVCLCVCVGRQSSLALAGSLSRRRKTLIQNRGSRSPLASPCDGRTHQSSRIFPAIGFWVRSLETWDDGAQRLLTLKISLRRLGGQPAVGASAQSVVLTASHSSFIEVPSSGQVCVASRCKNLMRYMCTYIVYETEDSAKSSDSYTKACLIQMCIKNCQFSLPFTAPVHYPICRPSFPSVPSYFSYFLQWLPPVM